MISLSLAFHCKNHSISRIKLFIWLYNLYNMNNEQGCLLQAADGYVWAGSFDKKIYIIRNQLDVTVRKVLIGHTDMVVDIIPSMSSWLVTSS